MFSRARVTAERVLLGAAAPIAAASVHASLPTDADESSEGTQSSGAGATMTVAVHSAPARVAPPPTSTHVPVHLVHSSVLLRHGSRTPVHVHGGVDTSQGWATGTALPHGTVDAAVLHPLTGVDQPVYAGNHELRFGSAQIPSGQLTAQGAQQLRAVGDALRSAYTGPGRLLSDDLPAALANGELYLRSTNTRRTVDSLRSCVSGLYPGSGGDRTTRVPIYTVSWDEEYVAPQARPCPQLAATYKAGRARFGIDDAAGSTAEFAACLSAHNWDAEAAAAALSSLDPTRLAGTGYTLSSLRDKVAALTGMEDPGQVNFIRLRDVLVAAAADGQSYPAGWDEELIRAIDAAGVRQLTAFSEGHTGHGDEVAQALRLGIGRLVQELALRLDQAAFAHSLHCAAFGTSAAGEGAEAGATAPWSLPPWVTEETYSALHSALANQGFFPPSTAGLAYVPGTATPGDGDAVVPSMPRLCVFSAHDSTLIPLLMALGSWDGQWPPFASTLAIELYSTAPAVPAGTLVNLSATPAPAHPEHPHHAGDGHRGHLVTSPTVLEALATAASGEDVAVEAMDLAVSRAITEGEGSGSGSGDDEGKGKGDKKEGEEEREDDSIVARVADAVEKAVEAVEHSVEHAALALAESLLGHKPAPAPAAAAATASEAASKLESALSSSSGLPPLPHATLAALDSLLEEYVAVAAGLADAIEETSAGGHGQETEAVQGLVARRDSILAEVRRLTGNDKQAQEVPATPFVEVPDAAAPVSATAVAAEPAPAPEAPSTDARAQPGPASEPSAETVSETAAAVPHSHAAPAEAETEPAAEVTAAVVEPEAAPAPAPVPVPTLTEADLAREREHMAALLAQEQARVADLIASERARIEELLAAEKERSAAALASSSKAVDDMAVALATVQDQLAKKVEDLRDEARQAFTWAVAALGDVQTEARQASSGVSSAADAAAAAVQHAREATEITAKAGGQVERAVLAQAAAVAETLRAHEIAEAVKGQVQDTGKRAEAAAQSAQAAASDASAARSAADNLSVAAASAASQAKSAADHAAAAELAAASASAHAARSSTDAARSAEISLSSAEAVRQALAAAEMAVAAARAAEESAATRAAELQVASQRADLMAQVAASRAEAMLAIATAADIARRAEAEAARAVTEAEVAKAKATAEAQAAASKSHEVRKAAEEEQTAAERAVLDARTQASHVLSMAQADMESALKTMRVQEDEARASVQATMAAIREELAVAIAKAEVQAQQAQSTAAQAAAEAAEARAAAQADVALAEAVAAERSALALAVAQAEADAAAKHVAEIRQRAEAEARAAQAESRAMAAEALAETRRVAEEALLAQALAEELISEARRQVREMQAETAAASMAAQEATAAARAVVEQEAAKALKAAEEVKAAAAQEVARARKHLETEQARLAQQLRIAQTQAQLGLARVGVAPAPGALSPSELDEPAPPASDKAATSEAAAAWIAQQLREAEEEAAAAPAVPALPVAAAPKATASHGAVPSATAASGAAGSDPYASAVAGLAAKQAGKRESAAAEANIQRVLAAMHLRDTPVNRGRAQRYMATVGVDRAVEGGGASGHEHGSKAGRGSKHAGEGSMDAVVPLPPVQAQAQPEHTYVAKLAAVTAKAGQAAQAKAVAAAPSSAAATPTAPAPKPSGYLDLFRQAAAKQGLPVPGKEEQEEHSAKAAAPVVAAPEPILAGLPAPSTLLDRAYLAALTGSKAMLGMVQQVAEAVAAPAAEPATAPAAPTREGESGYLTGLGEAAHAAQGLRQSYRARAQEHHSAAAGHHAEPAAAPSPAPAPVTSGPSLYADQLAAAARSLQAVKAAATAAGLTLAAAPAAPTAAPEAQHETAATTGSVAGKNTPLWHAEEKYLQHVSGKPQPQGKAASAKTVAHSPAHAGTDAATTPAPAPEYYVRVVYNGRALHLPGAPHGSELIPLAAFRALMSAYVPRDFLAECGLPSEVAKEQGLVTGPAVVSWPATALVEGTLPEVTASLKQRIGASTVAAARAVAPATLSSLAATGEDVAFDTIASDPQDLRVARQMKEAAAAAQTGGSAAGKMQ